jgi:hypothetical protein
VVFRGSGRRLRGQGSNYRGTHDCENSLSHRYLPLLAESHGLCFPFPRDSDGWVI